MTPAPHHVKMEGTKHAGSTGVAVENVGGFLGLVVRSHLVHERLVVFLVRLRDH